MGDEDRISNQVENIEKLFIITQEYCSYATFNMHTLTTQDLALLKAKFQFPYGQARIGK